MPTGYKPSVFLSSTCFDLIQVREDIRKIIESFGMDPVVSELSSFPSLPNTDTIKTCIQNVRNRCDIFILIIGSRYGFTPENNKSVTNLEYLEAKRKGVPIYAFINSSVMNALPIWRNNPNGNFSSHVENTKVFEFAEEVSHYKSNWAYKFETAEDIKSVLMNQIPFLFMDALECRRKLTKSEADISDSKYPICAINLIIEKPKGWRHLLFAELCKHYIDSLKSKRLDLKYGISFNNTLLFEHPKEAINWIDKQCRELRKLVGILSTLLNGAASASLETEDPTDDHERIQHLSQRLIDVYEHLLNWKISFSTIETQKEFSRLIEITSSFADDPIQKIEEFVSEIHSSLHSASSETGEINRDFTLTLNAPNLTEYEREFERLTAIYFPE